MESGDVMIVATEAVWVLLKMAVPILLVGLVLGLVVALFQALTQIQEMTLAFVPKMIGVFVAILLLMPFMARQLAAFQEVIMGHIATMH